MDCGKVGALLCRLRREKNMTQKQVAEHLNISDKTVSKWERGLGCPDVTLLGDLSDLFEIRIERILEGDATPNPAEAGNLMHVQFCVCPFCGNVIYNTGKAEVSCCGRKLTPLTAKPADEAHAAMIEDTGDEFYVTFGHDMRKEHYLSFVGYVVNDRLLFVKLYPEQEPAVYLPRLHSGALLQRYGRRLYFYCTKHGLYQL